MNKKIVLIIIIVILILGGFYFFQKNNKNNKDIKDNQINISEDLFILINKNEELSDEILQRFEEQFDKAITYIEEHPEDYSGWAAAGNIKRAVHDFDGAEQFYLIGLKNIPLNVVLHNNLAELYYHSFKNYEKAEEYYLKITALNPGYISAYLELATIYRVRFKDKEKAVNILKFGLNRNLKHKELMLGLANIYKKFEMYDEAKKVLEELINEYPDKESYKKELESLN